MLRGMRTARKLRLPLSLAVLAVVALLATSCGDDSSSSDSGGGSIEAVATTTQVADLVRQVGGERVDVHQMLQPNSDPHGYEPRPSDARELADADVIFQSGGELDEWLDDLIDNSGSDAPRASMIQIVQTRGATLGEHDHGDSADPHWWQDPRNAIAAVGAIRDSLTAADPEGRATYAANSRAYTARLRRLDRAVAACIDTIPPAKRKLVTTHDALGYYADRYGIDVVGALIPSRSTAAQPSARDTQELVEQIESEGVEAIFPESSLDPRLERAVARETGAEVGEALWADTLGPADSDGATYVDSIRSNTAALVEGLSGGAQSCEPRA
jgi:ABC-type Zn uptake system ZnuABC Zn-binding protein ZnuA